MPEGMSSHVRSAWRACTNASSAICSAVCICMTHPYVSGLYGSDMLHKASSVPPGQPCWHAGLTGDCEHCARRRRVRSGSFAAAPLCCRAEGCDCSAGVCWVRTNTAMISVSFAARLAGSAGCTGLKNTGFGSPQGVVKLHNLQLAWSPETICSVQPALKSMPLQLPQSLMPDITSQQLENVILCRLQNKLVCPKACVYLSRLGSSVPGRPSARPRKRSAASWLSSSPLERCRSAH